MRSTSKYMLYAPEWLISFEKEAAAEIVLNEDSGKVIQEYRKRYGISQEELGKLMGLRRESISRIENGSVNPTFDFVRMFIKVVALNEAIRVERAQHKEIDMYFFEHIAKEFGFSREKLSVMMKLAVQSYDRKLMKIQHALKEKRYEK